MKLLKILSLLATVLLSSLFAMGEQRVKLGDNAALRYWAAFSEMQDWAVTEEQAKQLNGILDGTVPYDDSQFGQLIEKNKDALEVMARGTALPNCDWGLDYGLAENTPVEYVRNALKLGRLNVLGAFHLGLKGDNDGAAQVLIAGIRFSHDVANGGTLFATLAAQDLLVDHFRAIEGLQHLNGFSPAQLANLRKAVARLGPEGLDWETAMRMEMAVLNRPDWQKNISLDRVTQAYVNALKDPSTLPQLEQLLAGLPMPLREVIPLPKVVVARKQEFENKLQHIRAVLQVN
ncbi:MAG TPA: hypothetical protein VJO35_04910 [Terriglobales bacterium]|nr:hypothetical protein [Terriglobales bacterium]